MALACNIFARAATFFPSWTAVVKFSTIIFAACNANASEKFGATADVLKVSEIFADEAQTYRRVRPRAQGRMYKRLKRTSHLTVKVAKD